MNTGSVTIDQKGTKVRQRTNCYKDKVESLCKKQGLLSLVSYSSTCFFVITCQLLSLKVSIVTGQRFQKYSPHARQSFPTRCGKGIGLLVKYTFHTTVAVLGVVVVELK